MSLPEFLLRLLIGVLVYWLGEKVIGLLEKPEIQKILTVVLIIVIVLYVIFGAIWPIK
jgi:Na+-driven multidrug efflux pump